MQEKTLKCSIVFCDSIQMIPGPDGQQTANMVTPLGVLTPYHVPGNYSFAIGCTILGLDTAIKNVVSIRFFNKETDTNVISKDIVFEPNTIKFNQPSNTPYSIVGFNIDARNIIFKETGTFVATVKINGQEIGNGSIDVFAIDQGE